MDDPELPAQTTEPIRRRSSRVNLQKKQFRPEFQTGQKDTSSCEKLWELMSEYLDSEKDTIQRGVVSHVEHTLAKTRFNFDSNSCYRATAFSIRDRLIESWNDTQQLTTAEGYKRVYYMSLEFLLGRLMQNNLVNINMESRYRKALEELGFSLENLYEEEVDPALGNGGLGRLAACFLDSLATLEYPAWGYGIRYDYGIFRQMIVKGYQVEVPDYWLSQQNPWEIERSDVNYDVHFGGHVEKHGERSKWVPEETVVAVAYDTPISGYDTFSTINLRLWRSRPTNEFDFHSFNTGDYFRAIERRQRAEYITSVLYPNDSTDAGKELRLKQQYFFCSASIQDVIRRFLKKGLDWNELPEKVAIQLNDTHPAISIPEMLRVLVDIYNLDWQRSWNIVHKVFSYTNHTVLPEALEKWSVDLIGKLLPRHMEIIYFMNFVFMKEVSERYGNHGDKNEKLSDMSLIEESYPKKVRMANLCIIGSHKVNGVAALHSDLVRNKLFKNFNDFFPGKFCNKTNGVTPRRWIHCANKELSKLYTEQLRGYEWLTNLDKLKEISDKSTDSEFQKRWAAIKKNNKLRLVEWVKNHCGVTLDPEALFDVMVKRIHEYKRQLLFALYMMHRYLTIKRTPHDQRGRFQKRAFMVGGKAAPGYVNAKKIIKLISSIGDVVNNDPDIGDLMKVVFLPNYCVSAAQVIIPAADLNEQISTAGTEASGTGNMKFVMNGAIIIGTMDGANVEIAEEVGEENMFIFGARVHEVDGIRERAHNGHHPIPGELHEIFRMLREGRFGPAREMASLAEMLERSDFYILCHDFPAYAAAQNRVDEVYKNTDTWLRMSIHGALHMGKFSSDRTINEYAAEIWDLTPLAIPAPAENALQRIRSQPHLIDAESRLENKRSERNEREELVLKRIEDARLEESLVDPAADEQPEVDEQIDN